ncbi:MAG: DUF4236 domain-containing protein [Cyanobacteria bacterium]|nr:DUF4236 domain-containing protein [Cyanobacteriota bacterium]
MREFALNHIRKAPWLLTWQADDAGMIQFWQHLRHQPLIAMGFRFRRSTRLGPLRFNFGKSGLSSISLGGRGASFNIPISRSGAPRTTVGLPGTGLSWSVEHSPEADRPAAERLPAGPAEGLPNSRHFRPGQLDAFKQGCLGVLQEQLFAPGSQGQLLWELNLVTRLLADPSIGNRTQGLLAVIETPEAMEGYLMRAQSQDDVKRRAHRCVEAAQEAAWLVNARSWLKAADLPLPPPPQA